MKTPHFQRPFSKFKFLIHNFFIVLCKSLYRVFSGLIVQIFIAISKMDSLNVQTPPAEELQKLISEKDAYHISAKGDSQSYLIAGVVLPVSYFYTLFSRVKKGIMGGGAKLNVNVTEHEAKVTAVCKQVKAWQDNPNKNENERLRTDRNTDASHSVRSSDKSGAHKIGLGDLVSIIGLSEDKKSILVEPGVTVGNITAFLTKQNLQLEATLEMEEATLVCIITLA